MAAAGGQGVQEVAMVGLTEVMAVLVVAWVGRGGGKGK